MSLPAISYLEDHSFTPDASPVIARIDFLRVTQMTLYTCSGVISWTWSGPVGLRITTVLALVIVVSRSVLVWPLNSRAERHGRYVTPVTCYTCNAMIVWTWYGPVGFRIPALFDLGDHSFAFRPSMATYELCWVTCRSVTPVTMWLFKWGVAQMVSLPAIWMIIDLPPAHLLLLSELI